MGHPRRDAQARVGRRPWPGRWRTERHVPREEGPASGAGWVQSSGQRGPCSVNVCSGVRGVPSPNREPRSH